MPRKHTAIAISLGLGIVYVTASIAALVAAPPAVAKSTGGHSGRSSHSGGDGAGGHSGGGGHSTGSDSGGHSGGGGHSTGGESEDHSDGGSHTDGGGGHSTGGGGHGAGSGSARGRSSIRIPQTSGHGGAGIGSGHVAPGGPSAESDGRGPRYGQSTSGTRGKPAWAQEGIPEVELGRLSVARSPDKIMDQQLAEVLKTFDPAASATLYSLPAAQFATKLRTDFRTLALIDSPVQNVALLKDLLADGVSQLTARGVVNDRYELAAIFIGMGSDKAIPVTQDTVKALSVILGANLTANEVAAIAFKAEIVRQAALAGHDA